MKAIKCKSLLKTDCAMRDIGSSKRFLTLLICLGLITGVFFIYRFYPFKTLSNGEATSEDETSESSAPFISTDEMLQDYDYMWAVLEDQFPFFKAAEQNGFSEKKFIDKAKIKQKYRTQIIDLTSQYDKDPYEPASASPNSVYNLYNYTDSKNAMSSIITQNLNDFRNLGHLRAMSLYLYSIYLPFNTFSQKTQAFYSSIASAENSGTKTEYDPNDYCSLDYINDIPIITITSFSAGSDLTDYNNAVKAVDAFCAEIVEGEYEDVIIDIRGNGGGDSGIWQKGLSRLFYDRQKPITTIGGFKAGCLDFFAQSADDNSYTLYPVYSDDPALLYPDEKVNEIMRDAGLDNIVVTTRNALIPGPPDNTFKGNVWLLVDSRCVSSSEMLALFCQSTGAATVIGTQTGGMGWLGFYPIFKRVELPNSGMCIEFEWIAYLNKDGSFNEFEGMTPDIETDRDALEVCLEMINNDAGK
ncbi:MAG: S41 family peptidase [Clostridiaceae bacterium]|nr:S41 family peptidase [Clostridiaceae bacterium]